MRAIVAELASGIGRLAAPFIKNYAGCQKKISPLLETDKFPE